MFRIIVFCIMLASIIITCYAQDLDTVTFTDQISLGPPNYRGGNDDDGPSGTFDGDWSFEVLTDGTAGLSGADVNYVNVFAAEASQGAGEIESPVIDVTSSSNINPDRAWTIPAIPANTRPGATSQNYAVLIGDDGGYNALGFGEWDDGNYEFKADVYLPRHTALNNSLNQFVRLGLAVRIQQQPTDPTNEELTIEGAAWITRPTGCYCLLYDSSEGNVYPTRVIGQDPVDAWDDIRDLSLTNAGTASPQVVEFYGTPIPVTEGWHTFGIKASGPEITFMVDDTERKVTDFSYSTGKAAILYRTNSSVVNTATYDHGGKFDNLRCAPAPPPPITDVTIQWYLFE